MLPARNRRDYDDIPEEVRKTLEFIWLERVEDAVGAALASWNRALNARDWALLQSVQRLRPGQLESYKQTFASKNVRQTIAVSWIAELAPTRFETEVVITREERKFFVWRVVGRETRQAIAALEGGAWRLSGL